MTPAEIEQFEQREATLRKLVRAAKCDILLRYFSIKEATDREDAVFQPFQIQVFNEIGLFASMVKSRQIGASFTYAGDALGDGMIKNRHTIITTSFNLEEAKEKIVYLNRWWQARCSEPNKIPTRDEFGSSGQWIGDQGNRIKEWPTLVRSNSIYMEYSNGFRFFSHPSKPPRGKTASVILDELAICQNGRQIYTAAQPMVIRGRGRNTIRAASTPLGASGQFYDITTDVKTYKSFKRWEYGWWEIFDLCEKKNYMACKQAYRDGMPVEEMVRRFGTNMLHQIFENTDLDSFLQEFHCQFLDSLHSFLSLELIQSCHPPYYIKNLDPDDASSEYIEDVDPDQIEKDLERSYIGFKFVATGGDHHLSASQTSRAIEIVTVFEDAIRMGLISHNLVFAYDCGRTRDASEIVVYEMISGTYKQRLMITLRGIEFEHQKSVIAKLFDGTPIRRGFFDKGGIGMELHEWAEKRYGPLKCQGFQFTNELKNEWATTMKLEMERRRVTIIPDRDQDSQLHSIRKKATIAGGLFQFVVEEQESNVGAGQKVVHHADKFWANAMAIWGCHEMSRLGGSVMLGGQANTAEETHRQVATTSGQKSYAPTTTPSKTKARTSTVRAFRKMGRG